jgi:hydrogenase maturation protein HypF
MIGMLFDPNNDAAVTRRPENPLIRRRIQVSGVVQGVGFRPYVYKLASEERLAGSIFNDTAGVTIEVEGDRDSVEAFLRRLPDETPPLARIASTLIAELPCVGETHFSIIHSEARGQVVTQIPADAATCDDCLRELLDPANRRYRYPFINCTNCGPRFTITRSIPYDRPQTSMAKFPMCRQCQAEYDDPANRRFHAQPNACWDCGPSLSLVDAKGKEIRATEPIAETVRRLRRGEIVAVKGIGGFHLAVDATNEAAVERLRQRKHRYGKPFAVMFRSATEAGAYCETGQEENVLLTRLERPILLLSRRDRTGIAPSVAPGISRLGVFLPYTPVHHLLFASGELKALVMTSANLSEEPIAIDNAEALSRLGAIADAFLMHDREILQRCDDSVLQSVEGKPQILRRGRGFVPLPVTLPFDGPPLLAVGGHLKNVLCLTSGGNAYQSQHLGDLENPASLAFFEEALAHLKRTFEIEPEVIAHDLHPGYLSTEWAERNAGVRLIAVQHHHAHIAACMGEHRLANRVIGLALDGTGYGLDGQIWGGEVLLCSCADLERFGHLKYVAMPGSEAAVREPWRMALSHLLAVVGEEAFDPAILSILGATAEQARFLGRMIERRINSPSTSSCGRLFDAAAALIVRRRSVDYEAQAAIELEDIASGTASVTDAGEYRIDIEPGSERWGEGTGKDKQPWQLDPAPMFQRLIADLRCGESATVMSRRFHASVAAAYCGLAACARECTGIRQVCLGGGVIHNKVLTRLLRMKLEAAGFDVFLPSRISPGDGGLSYGQAVVAAAQLAK